MRIDKGSGYVRVDRGGIFAHHHAATATTPHPALSVQFGIGSGDGHGVQVERSSYLTHGRQLVTGRQPATANSPDDIGK